MTTEIDPDIVELLQGHCSAIVYQRDEVIIYEGHVPRVGFILLEGKLEIIMSKRRESVEVNSGVGLKELASNKPYKYAVKIYPNTKVLPLDRSTLSSLEEIDDENIKTFVSELTLSA